MLGTNPLDDLRALIAQFKNSKTEPDTNTSADFNPLIKEPDFEDLRVWISRCQGLDSIKLSETHICILASAYDNVDGVDDVTSFIDSAGKGKEPVNLLSKERGVGLRVLEMAPSIPHKTDGLWPEKECMAATAFGMEAAAAGGDMLGISSFAPGEEIAADTLLNKLKNHKEYKLKKNNEGKGLEEDSLDLMRIYGGREIAGIVGSLIAARTRNLPVLAEGWAALGAMAVLHEIDRSLINHIQIASVSNKEQFDVVLELGKRPIIGPYVTMGPACGIVLALSALSPLVHM